MTRAWERWLGPLALGALLGVALLLRWSWHDFLPTYDEVRPLKAASFTELLFEAETGVNPPLFRWWVTRPALPADGLALGRWTATVGSVAALGMAGALARRLSGTWTAAITTVGVLAVVPDAVRVGVDSRVYGLAAATVGAHALALVSREQAWAGPAIVLTAALLPWLHYSTVPWLMLAALAATWGRPRTLLLYAPGALAAIPLALLIPSRAAERVAPPESPWAAMQHTLSLGLDSSLVPHESALRLLAPGVVVVGLLAAGALAAWRAGRPERVALALALAWPASVGVVGAVQMVRAPVFGLAASLLVPVAIGLAARAPRLRPAVVAAVAPILVLALQRLPIAFAGEQEWRARALALAIAADHALDGQEQVGVLPEDLLLTAYLARGVLPPLAHPDHCAGYDSCVRIDERRALVSVSATSPRPDLVLHTLPNPPPAPSGCYGVSEADSVVRTWFCAPGLP